MKQIKKFRKNNWSEDEETATERRNHKQKKFERALRTMDIDYLSDYDEE